MTWRRPGRWPGWDGWVLLGAATVAAALWLVRDLPGLGGWVVVVATLALGYALATRIARRRHRPSGPRLDAVRVLVVIPTRNNAGSIASVARDCLARHPHVVVIDDGSTDGSGRLAAEAGAPVLTHPENRGKGAALETALDHAAANGFSHILAVDADGQHLPDDIPSFLAAIRANPDAIVAGVRDMEHAPDGARYARANSNFWVWVETGAWLADTQCGFRAYPVAPVRALELYPSRYEWEVEVLTRGLWAGIPVHDHPCRVYYPPKEERVSSYRKVVDTVRISLLNTRLIAERVVWPPRWLRPTPRGSWRGGHRGGVKGWAFLLWILRVVGRRPMHAVVVPVAGFYWLFGVNQRRGVDAYLRRRFPGAGAGRRAWLALKVFVAFARALVDRFAVLDRGTEAVSLERGQVPEVVREELYAAGGFIVLSAHIGNPDLGSMLLRGKRDRPLYVLAHVDPDDPYVAMLRHRLGEAAPRFIPLAGGGRQAALEAHRVLRDGGIVAMKADRVVDGRSVEVDLLGAPARLPSGPFLIAALSGAPVVLVSCFARPDGRYDVRVDGPRTYAFTARETRDDDLRRWVGEYAAHLEAWANEYPLQWFNFHDLWR